MDGSGLFGSGIFGTGVALADPTTWGWPEYATLGLLGYVAVSVFSTTKAAGRSTVRKIRAVRKAARA